MYGDAATPAGRAGWVDERLVPLRLSRCFPEPAPLMAAYRLHRGIDARDVACAIALALLHSHPGWRLFVISAATPFLPADAQALWQDAPTLLARRWALPPRIDRVYDSTLAQQQLGWQPRHGVDELLRQWDSRSPEVLAPGAA